MTTDPTQPTVQPRIAPYWNNRRAALSFTFDDGFRQEVEDAVAIIDPLGLRGTFFLIPLAMGPERNRITWDRARQLLATGHELGTHDLVNFRQHELTPDALDARINGSQQVLETETGQRPFSYAMPGGSEITDAGLAKIYERHYLLRHPGKYDMVTASYGNTDQRQWDDQATRDQIDEVIDNGQWFVPIVHSIVGGWAPFKSKDEFREHCEYLASRQNDIWIAPMGEVGRYVMERDAAELCITEFTDNSITFVLTHTLPDKVTFNQPLTIVLSLCDAKHIEIAAGEAEATLVDDDALINARADAQPVTVRWQ